mmetsp:Transcript_29175/g.64494  ORF Transcript_29175/g.64494 Transcript_29175/m.64494 type:complete len:95 (-) Transcript_29175:577-861(-)
MRGPSSAFVLSDISRVSHAAGSSRKGHTPPPEVTGRAVTGQSDSSIVKQLRCCHWHGMRTCPDHTRPSSLSTTTAIHNRTAEAPTYFQMGLMHA